MIKLSLCKKGCCPTVEEIDGLYIIKDDFGGIVQLTREQMSILIDTIPKLENKDDVL